MPVASNNWVILNHDQKTESLNLHQLDDCTFSSWTSWKLSVKNWKMRHGYLFNSNSTFSHKATRPSNVSSTLHVDSVLFLKNDASPTSLLEHLALWRSFRRMPSLAPIIWLWVMTSSPCDLVVPTLNIITASGWKWSFNQSNKRQYCFAWSHAALSSATWCARNKNLPF